MKVETIKLNNRIQSSKKPGSSSSVNFADLLNTIESTEATQDVALTNFNPLFALQEFSDETSKAKDYGNSLLEELNELKLEIASGQVSTEKLLQIKETLQNKQFEIEDMNLKNLIEDIELRANIEILKKEIK
jgi:hypothetical protein